MEILMQRDEEDIKEKPKSKAVHQIDIVEEIVFCLIIRNPTGSVKIIRCWCWKCSVLHASMTIVFCLCILISRNQSISFINIFGHANHLTFRCSFASVVSMIVCFNFLLIWVDYLSQTINKNKMSVAACK